MPRPGSGPSMSGRSLRRTMRPYAPSGFSRRVLPVGARRRLAPNSSLATRTLSTRLGRGELRLLCRAPLTIIAAKAGTESAYFSSLASSS
jgi:hypothetical protein